MMGSIDWIPIADMPDALKDGRRILACVSADHEKWPGRIFEVRHEGYTPSGYDLGWALFPGYGGVDTLTFSHFAEITQPL